MISEEQALEIAYNKLKSKGYVKKKYKFSSCHFIPEKTGKHAVPARWMVGYMKPPCPQGGVIDDGDQLVNVEIEAESGLVKVHCGF